MEIQSDFRTHVFVEDDEKAPISSYGKALEDEMFEHGFMRHPNPAPP